MPRFSPYPLSSHLFVAGAAGDGGIVSINGRPLIGPSAGGNAYGGLRDPQWLNDHEIVCQYYTPDRRPALVAVHADTGDVRTLYNRGIVDLKAGGGRWWANVVSEGVLLDAWNLHVTTGSFGGAHAFGPDGTLAWYPWNLTGLRLRRPGADTDLWLSDGLVSDVQVFGDGQVFWREGDTVRAHGLTGWPNQVALVPGGFAYPRAVNVVGVWWLVYQSYALEAVVAHPADSLMGYRTAAPLAYRIDAREMGPAYALHAVWSVVDRDAPDDLRTWAIDLNDAREDLSRIRVDAPPPPPPVVVQPPSPKGPPVTTFAGIPDAVFATLQAERATYPAETLSRAEIGAILNATAYAHRHDPIRVGLEAKPSGTNAILPDNAGTGIWNGLRFIDTDGQHYGQDICGSCSVGKFVPVRGNIGPADPATFIAPVAPVVTTPVPTPTPEPNQVDYGTAIAGLTADVEALHLLLAGLRSEVEALKSRTPRGGLKARADALEARLTALEQDTYRVTGKTRTAFGHQHIIDLEVTRVHP